MTKINPGFSKDLRRYGAFDFNACYNCGNCTAVCSLSTEDDSFPREMVRFSVLGLENGITSSLKPWLCYYCGECSQQCPKSANPGELMMSLRRWLTAKYDWTGLSGWMYRSLPFQIAAFLLVAFMVVLFGYLQEFRIESLLHYGHLFEAFAIAGVFVLVLLPNLFRMWYLTLRKPGFKIPFKAYLKGAGDLFLHMFTQKRSLDCEKNTFRWFKHLVLVAGYLSLLFTTVALDWFGTGSRFIIRLGYAEGIIVSVVTLDFIISRIRKNREVNRYSRPSDWFFVIWLMLMGLSAVVVRIFIDFSLLNNHAWIYILHLVILAQWALIIVPFGKWTHFLYRSFAMYFNAVLREAGRR